MHAAAGYGSLECDIRGYGPGIPQYMTADVQQRSIAALQVLLDAGADPNVATTGGARGKGPGQTPLFGAAFWGWSDVAQFLATHGAKVGATDAEGRTAVDAALGKAGRPRARLVDQGVRANGRAAALAVPGSARLRPAQAGN